MTTSSVDRPALPFTAAEFAGRVARTRDLMRERGLEALLVFAPYNY